jgi:hypothetical protein
MIWLAQFEFDSLSIFIAAKRMSEGFGVRMGV